VVLVLSLFLPHSAVRNTKRSKFFGVWKTGLNEREGEAGESEVPESLCQLLILRSALSNPFPPVPAEISESQFSTFRTLVILEPCANSDLHQPCLDALVLQS
jgi:hypothetical protein